MQNILRHFRALPPLYWLLIAPFALMGPVMAWVPRLMWAWVVCAAIAVIPVIRDNWPRVKAMMPVKALLLYFLALGYSVVSAAWSPSSQAWARAIDVTYISVFGSIICLGFGLLQQEQRRLLTILFVLGWFIGLFMFFEEIILGHPIHRWFEGVTFDQPVSDNVPKRMSALYALSLWPLALFFATKKQRWLGVLIILLFAGVSYVCNNRSALLGVGVGFIALLLAFIWPRIMHWFLGAFIAFGIVMVVPAYLAIPALPATITDKLFPSAIARLEIWTITANHVLENPFFGHGIDASRGIKSEVTMQTQEIAQGISRISQHPHNFFLQLWLDFGAFGALFWGGLMLMLVYSFRRLPAVAMPYVLAASFCSLIMLSTTFSIVQAWWAGGHGAIMALFLVLIQSMSHKAGTKGTSAGGMG